MPSVTNRPIILSVINVVMLSVMAPLALRENVILGTHILVKTAFRVLQTFLQILD
jgi:hypothetical protein